MRKDLFAFRFSARMSAEEEAEVMLYGEIIHNMPDEWKWDEEDKSAADFNKALREARDKGAKRLTLRVNSPGGYVHEAVAMRGMLAEAGFEEITIRIEGICASAATLIASLPGAKVQIFDGAEYMIHNPWTFALGNADELEAEAGHLRAMEETARRMYAERTGQDEDTIRDWMEKTTWFRAEEAVKFGFADEVIATEKREAQPAAAMAVTGRMIEAMKAMYPNMPEMRAADAGGAEPTGRESTSGEPGDHPAIYFTRNAGRTAPEHNREGEEGTMEITREQLMAENRDIYDAILREGAEAERARIREIDDMTLPGYEELAAQAKANGTEASAFWKELVKASRQKGADYLAARGQETEKAAAVKGGAAEDAKADDEAELKAFAREMAEMAKDAPLYDGMN